MYVDASVIVAVLLEEPGFERYDPPLTAAGPRFTSPVAVYEAVVSIVRERGLPIGEVREIVASFLDRGGIRVEPVSDAHGDLALDAFRRFGKGRHPAKLNMGDCFAYAMAAAASVPILFKGDDFGQTDLASALPGL